MPHDESSTTDEATIRALIESFAAAFRDRDVSGVMAPFANEIVSFDIVPPLETVGAETFVTHWEEFFAAHDGPIEVEFPNVRITTGGDVAFSYCLHRIKGTLKSGRETDWWLRWTACWRKIDGAWLIVHEHVSVPTDLASGRALVDLEP